MIKLPNIKRKQNIQKEEAQQKQITGMNDLSKQIEKLNQTIAYLCNMMTNKQQKDDKSMEEPEGNDKKSNIKNEIFNQVKLKNSPSVSTEETLASSDDDEQQIQERYRTINFHVKQIRNNEDRQHHIKRFLTKLVNNVTSKGFYYFQKHMLNQQKFRFFCCRNILYKIIQYAKVNNLNAQQFKLIQTHLQQKVLPFVKNNYPTSQKKGSNLKLAKKIVDINNIVSNVNDLVFQSGVKLRKKLSGDYTQQILVFLNFLIDLSKEKNQDSQLKQQTLFELFNNDMESFFQKIQNQHWMAKAQQGIYQPINHFKQFTTENQQQKLKKQQQKYRQKVHDYTKVAIGKKIPSTIKKFTQEQINEQIPQIDNPSVMRILSKWIQQLEELFNTNQGIMGREQMFRMRDGSQSYITPSDRYRLSKYLQEQNIVLKQFLNSIKVNISSTFHRSLQNPRSQKFKQFLRKQQSQCGYFSALTSKCYSNYLLNYLNKLIDCILTAQQMYIKKSRQKIEDESQIISLISFKVGDLMRCKCSSKQTQIVTLFNYLNYLSEKQKEKIEIVRVKNRLNQGTKDILINLRYRSKILVQMQLSIDSDKSYFIQCSDKANHFLYELERASFGAISQMCNVFLSTSPQATILKKTFQQYNLRVLKVQKQKSECSHKLQAQILPFQCSNCQQFCSAYRSSIPDRKCVNCNYFICSRCFIEAGLQKSISLSEKPQQEYLKAMNKKEKYFYMKTIQVNKRVMKQKQFILTKMTPMLSLILFEGQGEKRKAKLEKQFKQFQQMIKYLKNHHLTKIIHSDQKQYDQLYRRDTNQIKRAIFAQKVKKIKKYHKKIFLNEQLQFFPQEVSTLIFPAIERINLNQNKIGNFVIELPKLFTNCQFAYLTYNSIEFTESLCDWKSLKQLYLSKNAVREIPKGFENLKRLVKLDLSYNPLDKVNEFSQPLMSLQQLIIVNTSLSQMETLVNNFPNLKYLNLTINKIEVIPEKINTLKNLQYFNMNYNKLCLIPQSFSQLNKIKTFYIQGNKISVVQQCIFNGMPQLRKLGLSQNILPTLPDSIQKCTKLQKLQIRNSKLQKWPKIFEISNLTYLQIFFNNQLKSVPNQIKNLANLLQLDLRKIGISQLPNQIGNLTKLKKLNISLNSLLDLPQSVSNLKYLTHLNVNQNQLQKFPTCLQHLSCLESLNLDNNKIKQIPEWINMLTNLVQLTVLNGSLQDISENIFLCYSLKNLFVSDFGLNKKSFEILLKLKENKNLYVETKGLFD